MEDKISGGLIVVALVMLMYLFYYLATYPHTNDNEVTNETMVNNCCCKCKNSGESYD